MSEPVGYSLSTQQSRLVAEGGADRIVSLTVSLPGVPAGDVPPRLDAAVAAPEVFRSTLESSAALREPVQVVHGAVKLDWVHVDDEQDLPGALDRVRDGLDSRSGPVLGGVVAGGPDGSRVALVASAVFADLATLSALVAEVAGSPAPDDPIQYAEYADWQAEVTGDAGSDDARAATEVWARLGDGEHGTRLPAIGDTADDEAAPASSAIEAAPTGPDPLAWWLAMWSLTVARLTGETEVTVGVEIDPRSNPELEGASGPYCRVVPLTVAVPATGSLSAFAARVAEILAQARTWIEWAPPAPALPLVVSVGPATSRVERGPCQAELRVAPEGGSAVLVAGSLGSAELLARAGRALTRVVAGPGDTVEERDVLDADEVATLLGTAPTPATREPVVARVLTHAHERPEAAAVTDGTTTLSYADLAARVERLAGVLHARSDGGPVTVLLPRSVDAVVALLAAQRAGLGAVPLDVGAPAERILLQARLAGSTVLVAAGAPDGFTGTVVGVDAEPEPDASAPPAPSVDDLAYVLFTSGSTGVPKGVLVRQDSLAGYADAVLAVVEQAAGRPGRELVWGQVTGLTTDLGNTSVYGALACGGTLHLVPSELLQDPAGLSAHLASAPVDVLKITPTHLGALLGDPDAHVLPREVLVLGGEALTWELVDEVTRRGVCRVVNHYGPTETTVGALTFPIGTAARPDTPTVPIGRPLAGYEALVVDSRLRLVPPGATGELLVAGVGVARGYVGDDEATASAFVAHPYRPGERAYRTGDLVTRTPDGAVVYLGRRDDQLKVRGFRVEPSEIELGLTQHPAVRRAAVVLRRDLGVEPLLVGYVVVQVNPSPSESDLRAHLADRLPEHMVPSRIVEIDALPLRANGKLDVSALPDPPLATVAAFEPPNGPIEEELAAILQLALGVPQVGAHDDFFALGGHSLLATRVVVEIRGRLGVQLPVYSLFDAPTVRQLAAEVESAQGSPSPEELAAMIAEISSLSDEEAALLLAEESQAGAEDRPENTS